ncbi:flagellar basal body P-ring protein FlgI [Mucisphaera sp.]|uniref:flagellar basal body P-ring protein FlgI n=1 Tax=Mucisphaera sp. TaxID=2913024 RepID=UPI003D0A2002
MWLLAVVAVLALSVPVSATQIGDLVRIRGAETSKMTGMGLVVGLNGTGDGRFMPASRPLAEMIGRLVDPNVDASELRSVNNVALVSLTVTVPAEGIREGDLLDVEVASIGQATSLVNGRLFMVPLVGPRRDVVTGPLAFAEGRITVHDLENPLTGFIENGATAAVTLRPNYMDRYGRVTLIIDPSHASVQLANNIANLINGLVDPDGAPVARAIDAKNIVVQVPEADRADIVPFLSRILDPFISPEFIASGAVVVVNEATGTIVFSDEVEISPVGISHRGLTIQRITPEPVPLPGQPLVEELDVVALDTSERPSPKLADLVEAFNQLKVSSEDRIAIIRALDRAKRLHARVIYE